MFTIEWFANFGFSVLRLSTPLIFAGLAAVISKKAGMMNMALEGMMLAAALGGVIFAGMTGNVWVGLAGAIVLSVLVSLIIAFANLTGQTDLYLTCIAVNLATSGGTVFVMYLITGEKSTTSAAIKAYTLPSIVIPLLKDIPLIGKIVSGHNILTYVSFISIFLVWLFLYRTKLGLLRRYQCYEDWLHFLLPVRNPLRIWRRIHVHGLGKLLHEEHGQRTWLHRSFGIEHRKRKPGRLRHRIRLLRIL